MKRICLFTAFAVCLLAEDKTESRLADNVIRAQRKVDRDSEVLVKKHEALDIHCKGKDQRMAIKPGGLIGCAAPAPPAPPAPPVPAPVKPAQ